MADRVQVILEAQDMASGVIRGIVSQFGALGEVGSGLVDVFSKNAAAVDLYQRALEDSSVSIADVDKAQQEAAISASRLAETVAVMLVDYLKDSYETFNKYADSVRDFSLVSGQAAEESSRFLQVLDDFQLTAEDATAAARFLKEQGLSPNIDTLVELSKQFQAIQDPAERMAFIQENLGRGGAKWVNVLSQSEQELRTLNGSINENLILSDEQIRKHELARLAADNLADSWEGLKIKTGAAIGELIVANEASQRAIEILKENGTVINSNTIRTDEYREALKQAQQEQEAGIDTSIAATEAYESQQEAMARVEEEARLAAEALQEMTDVNMGLLDLTMSISEENATYNEQLAETTAKYGENSEEVLKLKDAHSEAFTQIANDMLIAKLQADGFTDAEYAIALALMESTGQIDASAADTARAMDAISSAAQAAGEGGVKVFGDVMGTIMSDGVISNQELQDSLAKINAEAPTEQVQGLQSTIEDASSAGSESFTELQSTADSFSTENAIAEVDGFRLALDALPKDINIPVNVTDNTGATQFGGRSEIQGMSKGVAGGTVQNFYITSAVFANNGSEWVQI